MSYPVLAPVSEGYPKARGRLLTCYSPVRRSSTPERAFPLDLHVLSTPPAFVLSQDQTLQQKTEESTPATKSCQRNQPQNGAKLGTGFYDTLLSSQKTNTHRTQTPNKGPKHRGNPQHRTHPSVAVRETAVSRRF